MDYEAKRAQLVNTIYKLLKNHPYNSVRRQVDKIGRQIHEIDSKTIKNNA